MTALAYRLHAYGHEFNVKEFLILVLGATGAILAIFLKEAVQHALHRRVIAWQLFGYLVAWKANIVRAPPLLGLYLRVEEREKQLTESYSDGTEAFRTRWMEQSKVRDEAREEIKSAIQKALTENIDFKLDDFYMKALELGAESFALRRTMLADSKSFISDKDAAMLGRAVAMNVIQFRTSILDISNVIEGAIKLMGLQGEQRATSLAQLVDQVVILGESALIAFIRLERHVDRVSKQSVPNLVWSVLRGA